MNDSGNPPSLYLINAHGRLLATVRVPGATNRDWEDLAAAPGPKGRWYLYIADVGDNDSVRDDLVIYRVPEPRSGARETARPQAFPFRYPDGRHDAEAVSVDPASGRIEIVTKSGVTATSHGAMYQFPLPLIPGRKVTLERVSGTIANELTNLPFVTGAATSPDGKRLAIRTYWQAFEWRRSSATGEFAARPDEVKIAFELQGESIACSAAGKALVTTSEQLPAPIWQLTRRR